VALLGKKVAVAIPGTVLEDKESLREKSAKLGQIARACAIFGVDAIEVFDDPGRRGEGALVKKVLEFLETPQYLRKRLYPLDEALRYAGALPPLRIPSHRQRVTLEGLQVGEVREGVVNPDGTVEIGLEVPARFAGGAPPGRRVTVKVSSKSPLAAQSVRRDEVPRYWGYSVESKSLDEVFDDRRFGLKVATSRLGKPLRSALPGLRDSFARTGGVKLVFGAPSRGLFDMVGPGLGKKADVVLNLFAQQHVETVRTEEAVFSGLNLLNVLSAEKA
jgi:methyltransferase